MEEPDHVMKFVVVRASHATANDQSSFGSEATGVLTVITSSYQTLSLLLNRVEAFYGG